MSKFADRLKECRQNMNKTRREVATDLDMSDGGYQNYELGNREPNYQNLIKIADYFGVSVDYLLGRDVPK